MSIEIHPETNLRGGGMVLIFTARIIPYRPKFVNSKDLQPIK
jgi:hypothetical protein